MQIIGGIFAILNGNNMSLSKLREKINETDLSALYRDADIARSRCNRLIDLYGGKFGDADEAMLLSAPGRSEICGNHTDHNGGSCIAAAIDRDILAVAARRADGIITVKSEGRGEDSFSIEDVHQRGHFPHFKSISLIAGVVRAFADRGYRVGGFNAYTTTEVLSGSGLSSSAAFEVMIGNILNHLYNDGKIDNREIAEMAQYAENVYYGKPCGLLDQMASAVGGFVYLNFGSEKPVVEPISRTLDEFGYKLCIVAPGGSHSDLQEDYAAIPNEMRAVADRLGKRTLSGVTPEMLHAALPRLRGKLSDRALLRAMHFVYECERVERMKEALNIGDISSVLAIHRESGHSSFEYLQNVFTTKHADQGLSLAIAISDRFIYGKEASVRVHGGGFAGTIQALIPDSLADGYKSTMDAVFGEGATVVLKVRPLGAVRII